MFPKYLEDLTLSEESYRILEPLVVTSRLLGLCPVTFKKIGTIYKLKWSAAFLIYSYASVVALASLTMVGLISDSRQEADAVRMKDRKTTYITACDFSTVIFIDLFSVVSIPYRMKNFWHMVGIWSDIDALAPLNGYSTSRRCSIIFLMVAMAATTLLFCYDMFSYAVEASCRTCFLTNFTAYYLLYFMIFFQGVFIWHLLYFINIRIVSLNRCLDIEKKRLKQGTKKIFVIPYKITNGANDDQKSRADSPDVAARIAELLKVYDRIRESVFIFNTSPSFGVVMLILSCLIHLVVSPYFLLLEIIRRGSTLFTTLYLLWVIAHTGRLLMIVEPCHRCLSEITITKSLICELMRLYVDRDVNKTLKHFLAHLSLCEITFEGCGFFVISRNLLTTIAGAVTTYLVILFQFNNT
ncbi:gustatory receptor for sugar taste 43a-like isoform X2 [Cylas formicarius]|nr:gustatory receptor for sugar taste 43a-like isoform X2 [Cylas formicarius]